MCTHTCTGKRVVHDGQTGPPPTVPLGGWSQDRSCLLPEGVLGPGTVNCPRNRTELPGSSVRVFLVSIFSPAKGPKSTVQIGTGRLMYKI